MPAFYKKTLNDFHEFFRFFFLSNFGGFRSWTCKFLIENFHFLPIQIRHNNLQSLIDFLLNHWLAECVQIPKDEKPFVLVDLEWNQRTSNRRSVDRERKLNLLQIEDRKINWKKTKEEKEKWPPKNPSRYSTWNKTNNQSSNGNSSTWFSWLPLVRNSCAALFAVPVEEIFYGCRKLAEKQKVKEI